MPRSVTTCTEPGGCCRGRLAVGAVLLTLVLAASPSGAVDCDDWNTASFFASSTASDARACLAAGADPMARGQGGFTPLHFAAMLTDDRRIVEALLEAGANPMARAERDITPLHGAAFLLGDPVGVALLLGAGADPSVRDVEGLTPLHFVGMGAKEPSPLHGLVSDWLPDRKGPVSRAAAIVALLVEAGADPMARAVDKSTPLHSVSLFSSDPKIVKALANAGGNPSARADGGIAPLHYAVGLARNLSMTEALLEAGADPNARTDEGESPLHVAVTSYTGTMTQNAAMASVIEEMEERQKIADNPEIVEVLLAVGADPMARDADGRTALHLAAAYTTDSTIAVMLLETGSDIEAHDHKGFTPLHAAALMNANPAIIDVLIAAGADVGVGARAAHEWTALHMAAANNSPAIIDALIDAGADVSARAAHEITALHMAATKNANPAIIDALIDAGADVSARVAHEITALHMAAANNTSPAVIDALIDAGADPMELNDEGENAWNLAQRNEVLRGTAIYERLRALAGE